MKRYASALIILAVAAASLFAQAQAQAKPDPDPDWFWGKPIASFQWKGLKKADKAKLDGIVRDYAGKPFTDELWYELQPKLYALDWFESIEASAIPENDSRERMVLLLTVLEKPSISAVRVTGNVTVRTAEILDATESKSGAIYNKASAERDAEAIRKLYSEKGYPDTAVSGSVQPSKDGASLVLVFDVVEGEQVGVRRIVFTGNTAVPEKTLKSQMTLKEAALFQKGAFQETQLEESMQAILDYYRSRGFVDAEIDEVIRGYEKDEKSGKKWLILTIALKEGAQWNFGGMTFEGNSVFSSEKLQSLVTLKPGAVLNGKRLAQDKQRIDDLYFENGYIFNGIEMKETRNESARTIAFTVRITERERAHIESLRVSGNEKTREFVIRREVPLEVGDIFSKAKIIDGLRSLYNLQYFSAIEPQMTQGSAPNLMDLVINVEEQSMAEVQFGVTLTGIGSPGEFPVSGYVKWNDRNLGGRGQTLSTNVTLSPTEQSASVSFSEPWLLARRLAGSVSLSFKHSTETTAQDSIAPIFATEDIPDPYVSIDTASAGDGEWDGSLSSIPDQYLMPYANWDMSLGFSTGYTFKQPVGDISIGGGFTSGIGMRSYDADRYRPYESDLRNANGAWRFYNKLFTRAYLNKLDFWYNPGSGYFASQRLTWTGFFPYEHQFYVKSESRLDGYATLFSFPITENWKFKGVLGAHTGFQALLGQPWRARTVTEDWIYLDGTFNARGWKSLYDMQGIALWESSLELRFPVVDQVLWMDLFADAGAMQVSSGAGTGMVDMTKANPSGDTSRPGFGQLGWENMAFSAGLGLRFVIPQFPFRFYFVKRFVTDGASITWKNEGWNFDFVLSITQPLY